ncbi:MAG: NDP-sugar synthase [Thermoprotei archaeon]
MKAVVLAGGFSTRLRPLTNYIPKPLVPVVNKPIIEHVVERLREANVREIIFTLHYRAKEIMDYFGDGTKYGIIPEYRVEDKPLGTAGSVKNVEDLLDEVFIVVSGDVLFDFDLTEAIKNHTKKGNVATIVLSEVENVQHFGVAELNSDNRIVGFVEKPNPSRVKSRMVNTGIYVFNRNVLDLVKNNTKTDFSLDVFPKLVRQGQLYGFNPKGFWYDVGTFQGLLKAQREVLSGRTRIKPPGRRLTEGVYIQGEAEVDDVERLSGPALIGDGSKVEAGVVIKYSSIGKNTRLEAGSALIESIAMDECRVGFNSILAGVILGRRCSVSPNKSIIGPIGFGYGANI